MAKKKTEPSPAYLWYPKDVMSSGRVSALTALEELWYRRALDQSWLHEGLPLDPREFAGWVGRGCTAKAAEKIIAIFFKPKRREPLKVINQRQENERASWAAKKRQKSAIGVNAARKRWEHTTSADANALPKNAIPIPIPNKKKEEEKELPSGSSKKNPLAQNGAEIGFDTDAKNPLFRTYEKYFPHNRLTIPQMETIMLQIRNPVVWEQAVKFWAANDYRPQSIGKICGKYTELLNGDTNAANKPVNFRQQREADAIRDHALITDLRQRVAARSAGLPRSDARDSGRLLRPVEPDAADGRTDGAG